MKKGDGTDETRSFGQKKKTIGGTMNTLLRELGETMFVTSHRVTFRKTADDLTHMLEKIVRRK